MKSMQGRTWITLAAVVAVASLALWGCGGKKSAEQTTAEQTPSGTATTDTSAAGGEVSMAVGEQVFTERCVMCHGTNGVGDGPAGQALNPKPRNFHDEGYMNGLTDQYIHDTILNGKPGTGMPPHKGILTEAQVRSVMLKVRSFSKS